MNGGALPLSEAARYIGMSTRWLVESPIPKCDMRKEGGERAIWRWRKLDLDAFLEERLVKAGRISRMA